MLAFFLTTLILQLFFLLATLAQTPDTSTTIDAGEDVTLSVRWGSQPVNSYVLYAGSANDFQRDVSLKASRNDTYDPRDPFGTDYCIAVSGYGPGCAHLKVVLNGTSDRLSWQILGAAVTSIKGGAFYNKLWNYNSHFRVLWKAQIVGVGLTENRTSNGDDPTSVSPSPVPINPASSKAGTTGGEEGANPEKNPRSVRGSL